ncbi:SusD/RagB family nutrient-binding outer membrane lipoprotein [Chondrinema litorale]|uniref:SusD/RagB family nutrient-binding outer membrane lipoprotein n=1 Tax=Chondrinema litorale TaxID=2994555 RepID=UPI00254307C1|nr:SusD/RagB family nutrient-binding outer membrane lipoprotein [Chondrinema litorale]UZR94600.1 SusD/RagB family nutrient-binding outer membrane lipoprotein [Chondrinema litorale]
MKKYFYKWLIALMPAIFLSTSCSNSDFLDINTDPNFPAEASENLLLPAAQANAILGISSMLERGAATMVQHYINGRFDDYGFDGSTYNNAWGFHLYGGGLIDFQTIIEQGEANGNFNYSGIAKLQKAYVFSVLVDLFGDVPFSEALKGDINFDPKIDKGEDIYNGIFTLIDEGLADLEKESNLTLADDDLIYGGDLDVWKRMGNSLKLKMYNQMRLVDPAMATTQINQLMANGNLIESSTDNYSLRYGASNTPENRHPNYQADYAAGSLENSMSTYMNSVLVGNNDPRLPFYFYNQAACTFSGRIGGETSSAGDDEDRTTFGIYPIGGKYDDGSCESVSSTSGAGDGIFPMITYTMLMFIEAEAALTLGTTGDPAELLEAAISSAMADVSSFSGMSIEGADDYITARIEAYNAATTDEEKLEIIMMEKYVAMFGNGIESYTDFRRTGYPDNLNTPLSTSGPFPLRFPIPPTETTANANISTEVQDVTIPVFWDVN